MVPLARTVLVTAVESLRATLPAETSTPPIEVLLAVTPVVAQALPATLQVPRVIVPCTISEPLYWPSPLQLTWWLL